MTRQKIIYISKDSGETYRQNSFLPVAFACNNCINQSKCEIEYDCYFGKYIFDNTRALIMNMNHSGVSVFISLDSGESVASIQKVIEQAKQKFKIKGK
ncbi:MAG: hypothetical protein LBF37_00300 [Rickettsiales bacterium]|jgi:hypothetical protein|nr:hypothetical protein [Rickettsiales bacterium]